MKSFYPKCAQSFKQWCKSRPQYWKLYNELGQPTPFDVSLRDGIQSLTSEEQQKFTLQHKLSLYSQITNQFQPKEIEIGSIVNEKVLPVFKDTLELFKEIRNRNNIIENQEEVLDINLSLSITQNIIHKPNPYILVPNSNMLAKIINNVHINHLSFITSVSNSFQLKNTKMTLEESEQEIIEMMYMLDNNEHRRFPPQVKVYVSCINECPIEGKIDNDVIVHKILKLQLLNIDKICISDTCGSLDPEDFEYIIDTCHLFGLRMSQIALHLHVKKGREYTTEKIIHMALDRKIKDFDVSFLETGGCSVTMSRNELAPNLSYELYYKILYNYIMKRQQVK